LKINPKYVLALTGKGHLLILLGRGTEGVKCLETVLRLDPTHRPAQEALNAYQQTQSLEREDFYQHREGAIPQKVGLCSDRNYPCPETPIPRGTGYLYISKEAVEFMKAVKSGKVGRNVGYGPMPILACEQGAKLRELDMEVAAADAKRWWETGKVPLRPTPMAKNK
jgi:hypothetical protein